MMGASCDEVFQKDIFSGTYRGTYHLRHPFDSERMLLCEIHEVDGRNGVRPIGTYGREDVAHQGDRTEYRLIKVPDGYVDEVTRVVHLQIFGEEG
ncbi:MAG: hypothetical protein QF824_02600 [Candidatus Woesearchaeota archaeon]|jgi:hypothetical protein|nr:hypothetical protein [Candidatus Woesearchaeota archaeon]